MRLQKNPPCKGLERETEGCGRRLTRSRLEGGEVPLAQVAADVGVAVVEVAVAFAAVLHAQLVSVAHATADTIKGHSLSHQRISSTIDVSLSPHAQTGPPHPHSKHTLRAVGESSIHPSSNLNPTSNSTTEKRQFCVRGACQPSPYV